MSDESLGKFLMLESERQMKAWLRKQERIDQWTWQDALTIVTVGVWDPKIRAVLLQKLYYEQRRGVERPALIPDLDMLLRQHVPNSFHTADKIGGVSGIASMQFNPFDRLPDWKYVNPAILVAELKEGGLCAISGRLGSAKTSIAISIGEEFLRGGGVVFINLPVENPGFRLVTSVRQLLLAIAGALEAGKRWLFIFDDANPSGYAKEQASTGEVKSTDSFLRLVRHLKGNMVLVEQLKEKVPTTYHGLATMFVYAYEPGRLSITLKGREELEMSVTGFPKPQSSFDTYSIADFAIPKRLTGLINSLGDARNHVAALREYAGKMK